MSLVVTSGGGGVTGIQWVETRDTANHPTVHSGSPTTKNFLAHNVDSIKFDKSWSREKSFRLIMAGSSLC